MTNIINIQEDRIEFVTKNEFENCTIKLLSFSDDQLIYSTTFERYQKDLSYWISHSKILSEPNIRMLFYVNRKLLEELLIVKNLSSDLEVKLKKLKYCKLSEINTNQNKFIIFEKKELDTHQDLKKILVRIEASGMGDVLCATPTIRKISQSYSQKIDVMTKRLDVLEKNPYINNLLRSDEEMQNYDEVFDTFHFLLKYNKPNSKTEFSEKPMEIKMSNFEARQLHALGVGLTLYPEEMHYDFIPDEPTTKSQLIDKNTLVLHVTESWPSRTWSPQKWQRLIDLIKEKTSFKICLIGRSHSELGYFGIINKNVIELKNIDYDFTIRGENINQSDNDRKSLSEMWHILNNSYGLISFDAGPIHLAGVTDSWIFQIGASVRYEKTAPYRNQSQNYKFYFIGGECKLMCASDPKYAVKEWGSINSNPYYPNCQEGYSEFKCHPTPEMIVNKIIESYSI
jgi:ADP-heptose:LPS heptosyltransferase